MRWCARFELEAGRVGQAIERTLDGAWFAADLIRVGHFELGRGSLGGFLDDLARALSRSTPALRGRIARAAQTLEACLPDLDAELIGRGTWAAQQVLGCEPWWIRERERYGFRWWNAKLRLLSRQPVDLVDAPGALAALRRMRSAIDAPWPRVRAELVASRARARLGSWFGLSDLWLEQPDFAYFVWRQHRSVLAQLRLLRAAGHQPIGDLVDPFGDGAASLRERRESGRRVLWSIGEDGVDDGGPALDDEAGFQRGPESHRDLVLVVPSS